MPHKMPYDPVPPYDLEDLEAAPAAVPAHQNGSNSRSNHNDDGDDGQHLDTNNSNDSGDNEIVMEPHRRRAGKLTERECCAYAFAYFLTSVVGVLLVVLIIAYFNYLTRRGKK